MVATAVPFCAFGSGSLPATVVVAVKRPVAVGVTVSEIVAEAPRASEASEQLVPEQLPTLVLAAFSVSCAGSVALTVTAVAVPGPAFETTIAIVAALPCTSGVDTLCLSDRSAGCGGAASTALTLTVNEPLTGLFASSESLAVQVTVVLPIPKVEPEAGVQTTVAPASSSTAVGGV